MLTIFSNNSTSIKLSIGVSNCVIVSKNVFSTPPKKSSNCCISKLLISLGKFSSSEFDSRSSSESYGISKLKTCKISLSLL